MSNDVLILCVNKTNGIIHQALEPFQNSCFFEWHWHIVGELNLEVGQRNENASTGDAWYVVYYFGH